MLLNSFSKVEGGATKREELARKEEEERARKEDECTKRGRREEEYHKKCAEWKERRKMLIEADAANPSGKKKIR
jgi:hypothetical protein